LTDLVLVAEDEIDIQKLVRMILERNGFNVIESHDGIDAEYKIQETLPDIALVDVVMPEKGGFEVCKTIKSLNKTQHIPIIIFTVLGRDIDKKMSKEAGADGHFMKPFQPEELVKTITETIEQSKKTRFARSLKLPLAEVLGKKYLFEYDSRTRYERTVRDFILEGVKNGEKSIIITRDSSVLHSIISKEEKVDHVPLRVPVVISPLLTKYDEKKVRLVFDSLSDLILSSGFQSTYNLVRDTLPKISGNNYTTLFLLNPESHEMREVESLRNLFSYQLEYTENGVLRVK
jgi:DNA-binding response OmpR family regulator